jgi:hypothetical protein
MRLFGINVDLKFEPDDIETHILFEDWDEQEHVDDVKDAWEDDEDRWHLQKQRPPEHKVWWR